MRRLMRGIATFLAALATLAALFAGAFVLARTSPGVNPFWFFGVAGTFYTVIVLYFLDSRSDEANRRQQGSRARDPVP